MQELVVDLLDKLPNHLLGVPKLKSFWLSKLKKEIHKFCPLSKNFSMDVNLLDPSENYLWFGCTPKKIINFLNGNLLSDSVFIDCGTNIGIWSIIACESIKGKGTVHSFEPNPLLLQKVKKKPKL